MKLIITATVFPAIALAFAFIMMLMQNAIWVLFVLIAVIFQVGWLATKFR